MFRHTLQTWLREPLVQFLLIGACIYGAYAVFGTPDEDFRDTTIHVDGNRIDAFISQWERRWNRPPTRQEIDGLIQTYVREDILYRQAVAMGLNKDDPITRRRMAQKLEFLTRDIAGLQEPEEGELEQYFEENRDQYKAPDLLTFSHVFLDPDVRGDATLDDAALLLAELQAAGPPDSTAPDLGDRFMLQNYYPQKSELNIRKLFGTGFSEAIMPLEAGQWHGPVLSGYGTHLVYVYALKKAPLPLLKDVRDMVLQNWQVDQQDTFNEQFFESLKSRYDIVIDELPADRLIDGRIDTTAKDKSGAEAEPAS